MEESPVTERSNPLTELIDSCDSNGKSSYICSKLVLVIRSLVIEDVEALLALVLFMSLVIMVFSFIDC